MIAAVTSPRHDLTMLTHVTHVFPFSVYKSVYIFWSCSVAFKGDAPLEAIGRWSNEVLSRPLGLGALTCSPKTSPPAMRVNGPRTGKETLDEAEASQSRADHRQAA